jgi:hypothetical protein
MWNTWSIEINLPSLGSGFGFAGLNSGNNYAWNSIRKSFNVSPGVYLLTRSGVSPQHNWNSKSKWGVIRLGEYAAPEHTNKYYVVLMLQIGCRNKLRLPLRLI